MSCEGITENRERIEEVVKTAIRAMQNKEGFFNVVDPQPEKPFIDLVKKRGPEYALNATVLMTSMVFGSRTERFSKGIANPERFNEFSYLFEPKIVASLPEDKIINDCFIYFHPQGYQSNTIYQWSHNCKKIAYDYGGLFSNYFKARDDDALQIYKDLIVYPRAKTEVKEIRRFGPKITKLMIQWVREYNLYDLKNTDLVGLPVDFQLGRVMRQCNGITFDHPINDHTIVHNVLPPLFEELRLKGYRPEDISKSIWAIGSGGCATKWHDKCPLENMCTSLISAKRYSEDGVFDPKDTGRYK